MKYKVGDRVKIKSGLIVDESYGSCYFADGMKKYYGKTAEIVDVSDNDYEINVDGGSWSWTDEMFEDKKLKPKKVNFLLKYDLDEDPIEEFETMKEVDDRIKELVEEEDSLKKDSIVIYEVKAKHEVKVETKISKKLIK